MRVTEDTRVKDVMHTVKKWHPGFQSMLHRVKGRNVPHRDNEKNLRLTEMDP
jgi:hypothetical protein